MRYFLDTEFNENGHTIELISIGIVAEDGREFYACNGELNLANCNPWVRENVLPHLPAFNRFDEYYRPLWRNRSVIAQDVIKFVTSQKKEKSRRIYIPPGLIRPLTT